MKISDLNPFKSCWDSSSNESQNTKGTKDIEKAVSQEPQKPCWPFSQQQNKNEIALPSRFDSNPHIELQLKSGDNNLRTTAEINPLHAQTSQEEVLIDEEDGKTSSFMSPLDKMPSQYDQDGRATSEYGEKLEKYTDELKFQDNFKKGQKLTKSDSGTVEI